MPQTVSGQPGDEQRHAPDVQRLLADLADAAHLDVLDLPGIEVEPPDEAVQRLRGELLGANAARAPFRRPIGVRIASTMSASVMP